MANWLEQHEKQSELLAALAMCWRTVVRPLPEPARYWIWVIRSFAAGRVRCGDERAKPTGWCGVAACKRRPEHAREPGAFAFAGYPVHFGGDGLYQ